MKIYAFSFTVFTIFNMKLFYSCRLVLFILFLCCYISFGRKDNSTRINLQMCIIYKENIYFIINAFTLILHLHITFGRRDNSTRVNLQMCIIYNVSIFFLIWIFLLNIAFAFSSLYGIDDFSKFHFSYFDMACCIRLL